MPSLGTLICTNVHLGHWSVYGTRVEDTEISRPIGPTWSLGYWNDNPNLMQVRIAPERTKLKPRQSNQPARGHDKRWLATITYSLNINLWSYDCAGSRKSSLAPFRISLYSTLSIGQATSQTGQRYSKFTRNIIYSHVLLPSRARQALGNPPLAFPFHYTVKQIGIKV